HVVRPFLPQAGPSGACPQAARRPPGLRPAGRLPSARTGTQGPACHRAVRRPALRRRSSPRIVAQIPAPGAGVPARLDTPTGPLRQSVAAPSLPASGRRSQLLASASATGGILRRLSGRGLLHARLHARRHPATAAGSAFKLREFRLVQLAVLILVDGLELLR